MWRYVIKSFERTLNSHLTFKADTILKIYISNHAPQRFFSAVEKAETEHAGGSLVKSEVDPEYIVPYKKELEGRGKVKILTEALRSRFRFSRNEVEHIMKDEILSKTSREMSLLDTLEMLRTEGVTKQTIIENPWLLTLDNRKLIQKINLLKTLHGFRDINDFVPFIRLQFLRLKKLIRSLNKDDFSVDHGNRVYFLADKLNLPPCIVTKYLVKRLFVLEIPSEMFRKNLQYMVNYGVEPMSILRDLWGFRYAPRSVEMRLQRALQAKKDKIMPWMVRCPEPILQKSLQLSLDELEVLGDKTSVAEYIGERLGFCVEEAQAIMNRHPQVNAVRVTKIKEVLDYLLNEAKFTTYEVASVPRILCHSLETTKQRIEELAKNGCKPSSLVIVCRSKREYKKFLEQWQRGQRNNIDKKEVKE